VRLTSRLARLLAALAAGVFLLAVAAAGGLWFWLGTAAGARFVFERLQILAAEGGLTLEAADFEGPLPGRLRARRVRLGDAEGPLAQAELLEAEFNPMALWRGLIHLPLVRLTGPELFRLPRPAGPAEPDRPPPALPVNLKVDELALVGGRLPAGVLNQTLGLDLPALALDAEGGLNLDQATADFHLNLHLGEPEPTEVGDLRLNLQAALGLDLNYLRLQTLELTGAGLRLTASGGRSGAKPLQAQAHLELAAYSPWLTEGLIRAGLDPKDWGGDLSLTAGLAWPGPGGPITGQLELAGQNCRRPAGLTAALLGPEFSWRSGFSGGPGRPLTLDLTNFSTGGIRLTGAAAWTPGPAAGKFDANLQGRLDDLAAILPGWSGPVNLKVEGAGHQIGGHLSLSVAATSPELASPQGTWRGLTLRGGLSGGSADPEAPDLDGRLAFEAVSTPGGPLTLETGWRLSRPEPNRWALALERLKGNMAGLTLHGDLTADLGSGSPALAGDLAAEVTDWAALAALSGRRALTGGPTHLDMRLRAEQGGQKLQAGLDIPSLTLGSPSAPELSLTKTKLSLAVADLFGEPNLNLRLDLGPGRAAGRAWAKGRAQAEAVSGRGPYSLTLEGLTTRAGFSPGRLEAAGKFDLGRSTADLARFDLQAGPAGLKLANPVTFSWSGPFRVGPVKAALRPAGELSATADLTPGRMKARLDFIGPLEPLWRLAGLPDRSLTGRARLNLNLAGTPDRPRLEGSLRLTGARYEDKVLGIWLRDLNLSADSGPDLSLKFNLTGRDTGRGEINLQGEIPNLAHPILKAGGSLKAFKPFHRDDLSLTVSGGLGVEGPLNSLALTSEITVDEGDLDLNLVLAGGSIATLPLSEPGREDGAAPPPAGSPRFDLQVAAPGRFRIHGYGLDSEWRGRLRLQSRGGHPELTGALHPVRGWYEPPVFSKQFDFAADGQITFTGGFVPNLDLELTNQGPNIMAIIKITGSARRPDIRLTSRPPLNPDEVAAQVLFGKSASEFSRFEALQLAAALKDLPGFGGGGLNPLQTVRETVRGALGLDVLRLGGGSRPGERQVSELSGSMAGEVAARNETRAEDGEEDSAVAVEAGKYITDKIYMGVEHGGGGPAVRLEVELAPNVSLEARSSSTSSQVGLGWKKDY
jgi:autotransporter translocation and assembly factor TamB